MNKLWRSARYMSIMGIGAIVISSGLSACTSSDSASPESGDSASSDESREAYAGTRNVRICMNGNAALGEDIDLGPIQGSKGDAATFTGSAQGPACYTSDNSSFNGTAGVNVLYEDSTIIVYGQNLSLQRPDLLLCTKTVAPVIGPVDCAGDILSFQTFSEGDVKTLKGKVKTLTGEREREFSAKRKTNTSDYIEFDVTIVK